MSTRKPSARMRMSSGAVAVAAVALIGSLLAPPASAAQVAMPVPDTVELSGVLVVLPVEGVAHDLSGDHDHDEGGATVRLLTDDGASVQLAGIALADAETGARFEGTVAVTGAVRSAVSRLAARDDLPLGDAALGEEIADIGASLEAVLPVVTAEITPVAAAIAAKKHTADVMFLGPTGTTPPAATKVSAAVSALSSFWATETAGQVSQVAVNAVKYDEVTTSTACNPENFKAWNYAAKNGFNHTTSNYYLDPARTTHLIVLVPEDMCPGATLGLGTIGTVSAGGVIWARVGADERDWNAVLFHEFGHNVGLWHANESTCDYPVELPGTTCAVDEYADYYDVMSAEVSAVVGGVTYSNNRNVGALNVTSRVRLDALGAGLASATIGAGDVQTFSLAAASAASGTRGISVTDPYSGRRYYLEYRSGTGRDALALYRQLEAGGVGKGTAAEFQTYGRGVRVLMSCPPDSSKAPCAEPGSLAVRNWISATDYRLVFGAGESFQTSATAGVTVAVTGVTADAAQVTVTFNGDPAVGSTTPTISGTARVGSTLTAKTSWSSGAALTYQWKVNGTSVKGATKSTYVPSSTVRGKTVTVTVTGTKAGYATTTKTSKATAKVGYGVLKTATPKISGTVKVGKKLTVVRGTWTSGTTFSYQWYTAGKAVKGATKSTFTPRSSDAGKTVSVKVTGKKSGYTTASKTSAKTRAVAR